MYEWVVISAHFKIGFLKRGLIRVVLFHLFAACRVRKYDKHVSSAGTRKHIAVGSSMQVRCKPNYYTVGSVDVSCKVRNGSNSSHGFYVAEALFTTFPTCEGKSGIIVIVDIVFLAP